MINQFTYFVEESQYSEHNGGWIQWFCSLPQNSFMTQLDEDFIQDPFHLSEIKSQFTYFQEALEMILSPDPPDTLDLQDERFIQVYQDASDLYGLLHKQFIQTVKGLAICREHFLMGKYGLCPRVYCEKQHAIPMGISEDLKTARIKIYCPRCKEAYQPRRSIADFDGAYFGKSFPQLLLMSYPDIQPVNTIQLGAELFKKFEPTLFGFKIRDQDQEIKEMKQIKKEEKVQTKVKQKQQEEVYDKENEIPEQQSKKQNKNKNKKKTKGNQCQG